jgi:hypothetical protein
MGPEATGLKTARYSPWNEASASVLPVPEPPLPRTGLGESHCTGLPAVVNADMAFLFGRPRIILPGWFGFGVVLDGISSPITRLFSMALDEFWIGSGRSRGPAGFAKPRSATGEHLLKTRGLGSSSIII